ncbi:hypothetical protein AMECASPLE_022697 [Ameca splendens]|uniref:Uncharacterized protein n=1 Tax=Ameca splendens TaxID=208324 RepID=A0ABV0Z3V2_9TELE
MRSILIFRILNSNVPRLHHLHCETEWWQDYAVGVLFSSRDRRGVRVVGHLEGANFMTNLEENLLKQYIDNTTDIRLTQISEKLRKKKKTRSFCSYLKII